MNTFLAMAIDVETRRPVLSNVMGGLSGPAIRPIAVRMVYECREHVRIPIIGMGGVQSAEDVLEFLLAGASAVAVGTANFVNPFACPDIIDDLPRVLEKYGYRSLNECIGRSWKDEQYAAHHRA